MALYLWLSFVRCLIKADDVTFENLRILKTVEKRANSPGRPSFRCGERMAFFQDSGHVSEQFEFTWEFPMNHCGIWYWFSVISKGRQKPDDHYRLGTKKPVKSDENLQSPAFFATMPIHSLWNRRPPVSLRTPRSCTSP